MKNVDFKNDLRNEISRKFTEWGISYSSTDLRAYSIHYFNTKQKLITPRARTVYFSSELETKYPSSDYEKVLLEIKQKFENGDDVNAHLSKLSLKPTFDDKLLSDWVLHHLHLSNTRINPSQYFYDRSSYLLFVLIKDNDSYFVDVRPHSENDVFARRDFISIIQKNWNDLIKPFQLPSNVVGLSKNLTDSEISELRKNNINAFFEVNGRFYGSIGGGYMTSGDSMSSVIKTTDLLKDLDVLESIFINNDSLNAVKNSIKQVKGEITHDTIFNLVLKKESTTNEEYFVVRESFSGCEFVLRNGVLILIQS